MSGVSARWNLGKSSVKVPQSRAPAAHLAASIIRIGQVVQE